MDERSDSCGKGQESSADKNKASKAPKEDDGVCQFACRGYLDTILCPCCNILRACIGTGSSPIKDIQGDFYSLSDYTDSVLFSLTILKLFRLVCLLKFL